ncbi:MAG: hypothetical protein IT410_03690 [Candidatus Doudnabacteria bacterium]|nr:hypothetical protein [Candidatus Doudnabacteria bacterium]
MATYAERGIIERRMEFGQQQRWECVACFYDLPQSKLLLTLVRDLDPQAESCKEYRDRGVPEDSCPEILSMIRDSEYPGTIKGKTWLSFTEMIKIQHLGPPLNENLICHLDALIELMNASRPDLWELRFVYWWEMVDTGR